VQRSNPGIILLGGELGLQAVDTPLPNFYSHLFQNPLFRDYYFSQYSTQSIYTYPPPARQKTAFFSPIFLLFFQLVASNMLEKPELKNVSLFLSRRCLLINILWISCD
tara:strand:+ start:1742 stop:2065 length:324 start_codon:yes stop_codon:yes gene_type:complete